MMETSYAIAKRQKPTETEQQEDIILQGSDFTDIITNKNINLWKI
jgi:hypothetical protein